MKVIPETRRAHLIKYLRFALCFKLLKFGHACKDNGTDKILCIDIQMY